MSDLKCQRCLNVFSVKDHWDYPKDRECETECPKCGAPVKFILETTVRLRQIECSAK